MPKKEPVQRTSEDRQKNGIVKIGRQLRKTSYFDMSFFFSSSSENELEKKLTISETKQQQEKSATTCFRWRGIFNISPDLYNYGIIAAGKIRTNENEILVKIPNKCDILFVSSDSLKGKLQEKILKELMQKEPSLLKNLFLCAPEPSKENLPKKTSEKITLKDVQELLKRLPSKDLVEKYETLKILKEKSFIRCTHEEKENLHILEKLKRYSLKELLVGAEVTKKLSGKSFQKFTDEEKESLQLLSLKSLLLKDNLLKGVPGNSQQAIIFTEDALFFVSRYENKPQIIEHIEVAKSEFERFQRLFKVSSDVSNDFQIVHSDLPFDDEKLKRLIGMASKKFARVETHTEHHVNKFDFPLNDRTFTISYKNKTDELSPVCDVLVVDFYDEKSHKTKLSSKSRWHLIFTKNALFLIDKYSNVSEKLQVDSEVLKKATESLKIDVFTSDLKTINDKPLSLNDKTIVPLLSCSIKSKTQLAESLAIANKQDSYKLLSFLTDSKGILDENGYFIGNNRHIKEQFHPIYIEPKETATKQAAAFYLYPRFANDQAYANFVNTPFNGFDSFSTAMCFLSSLRGIAGDSTTPIVKHDPTFHGNQQIEEITALPADSSPYEIMAKELLETTLCMVDKFSKDKNNKKLQVHLPTLDYLLLAVQRKREGRMTKQAFDDLMQLIIKRRSEHVQQITEMCKQHNVKVTITSPFASLFDLSKANESSAAFDFLNVLGFAEEDEVFPELADETKNKKEEELVTACLNHLQNKEKNPSYAIWQDFVRMAGSDVKTMDKLFEIANAIMLETNKQGQHCSILPHTENPIHVSHENLIKQQSKVEKLNNKYGTDTAYFSVLDPLLTFTPKTHGNPYYCDEGMQASLSSFLKTANIVETAKNNIIAHIQGKPEQCVQVEKALRPNSLEVKIGNSKILSTIAPHSSMYTEKQRRCSTDTPEVVPVSPIVVVNGYKQKF